MNGADNDKTLPTVAALLVIAIFVGLVCFGANGVRGTDQYWYVADLERMAAGQSWTTNNIFPINLATIEAEQRPRFIHNVLTLYLVWPAATWLGSYAGWITTNVVASVLTGLLICTLLARTGQRWLGVLGLAVYLLLPLTVFQTSQPMAEATIAPIVMLATLFYVHAADQGKYWVWLLGAVVLALYCRATFLPLLLLIPPVFFMQSQGPRSRRVAAVVSLLGVALLAVALKGELFPSGAEFPTRSLLTYGIPGVSNSMANYFETAEQDVVWQHVWLKSWNGLIDQLLPPVRLQPFYLPVNILALLGLALLFQKETWRRRISQCALVSVVLHLVTVCLCQNQFRYMLTALPPVVAAGLLTLDKVSLVRRKTLPLLITAVVILFAVNVPIVNYLRQQSNDERLLRERVQQLVKPNADQDDVIVIQDYNTTNCLAFALRPMRVMFARITSSQDLLREIDAKLQPNWLLCPKDSVLLEHYTPVRTAGTMAIEAGLSYTLYEI